MQRRLFLFGVTGLLASPALASERPPAATGALGIPAPAVSEAPRVLYVNSEYGRILSIDHPIEKDPELMMTAYTNKDVIWQDMGWWDPATRPTRAEWREIRERYGIRARDLDKLFDPDLTPELESTWHTMWLHDGCPASKAHDVLSALLEPVLMDTERTRYAIEGGLEFVEPANDGESYEVYVLDDQSIPLLRDHLGMLGANFVVEVR